VRAVVCTQFGPIENLSVENCPDPVAGEGQLVVDIRAAAINFPDGLTIRGEYQVKPTLPFTPGSEAAGIVSAVGPGVSSFSVGQRVIVLCVLGGFAEKVVVVASQAHSIPDAMHMNEAAGFALAYGTALHALQDKGNLKPGETLIVLGAAGGVGLATIEVGKAMGARVIAAASTDEKVALALAHGADCGINYTKDDLRSELKRICSAGVDVILDPVGGPNTEAAVRSLSWCGRLLVVGFAQGEIPKLPVNLLLLKEAAAIGVFWGQFIVRNPVLHLANLSKLMDWFEGGKLKPFVSESYELDEAKEALARVMNRRAKGKIVVTNRQ
jgi:NADPH2:quinone reductase